MKPQKTIASLAAEKKRVLEELSRLGKQLGMHEKRIADFRQTLTAMEQYRTGLIDRLKEESKYLAEIEIELNSLNQKDNGENMH